MLAAKSGNHALLKEGDFGKHELGDSLLSTGHAQG